MLAVPVVSAGLRRDPVMKVTVEIDCTPLEAC